MSTCFSKVASSYHQDAFPISIIHPISSHTIMWRSRLISGRKRTVAKPASKFDCAMKDEKPISSKNTWRVKFHAPETDDDMTTGLLVCCLVSALSFIYTYIKNDLTCTKIDGYHDTGRTHIWMLLIKDCVTAASQVYSTPQFNPLNRD